MGKPPVLDKLPARFYKNHFVEGVNVHAGWFFKPVTLLSSLDEGCQEDSGKVTPGSNGGSSKTER
jgi:hypothetical protein